MHLLHTSQKHYCLKDVPGIMQLLAGLSSETMGSTPDQHHRMKQQQDKLSSKSFQFLLSVSFYETSMLINSPITDAKKP
jgi:hypothetical protein